MQHEKQGNQNKSATIAKEIFFGLIAIGLGVYNLLNQFGILNYGVEIPQMIGNALLVLVGFILLITAYKLWRYRWHSSRLF